VGHDEMARYHAHPVAANPSAAAHVDQEIAAQEEAAVCCYSKQQLLQIRNSLLLVQELPSGSEEMDIAGAPQKPTWHSCLLMIVED
jgi:hypothetical protein